MPLENLPSSTGEIAIGRLFGVIEVEVAIGWAQDLLAADFNAPEILELAILQPDEWQEMTRLLPRVAASVGFDLANRTTLYAWAERRLLLAYLEGSQDEAGLVARGYKLWVKLLETDPENPFVVYNNIDDGVGIETGRSLSKLPRMEARAFVLRGLAKHGAFQRAGLPSP